jgi:hypothetical protein
MTPIVLVSEPGRTPLRIHLGPDPVEIGRDRAGILLTDSQISRRHLELRRSGFDLGSTNGSRVDDVYEIAATRGDICFGETRTVAVKGIAAVQTVHVVDWR